MLSPLEFKKKSSSGKWLGLSVWRNDKCIGPFWEKGTFTITHYGKFCIVLFLKLLLALWIKISKSILYKVNTHLCLWHVIRQIGKCQSLKFDYRKLCNVFFFNWTNLRLQFLCNIQYFGHIIVFVFDLNSASCYELYYWCSFFESNGQLYDNLVSILSAFGSFFGRSFCSTILFWDLLTFSRHQIILVK